MTITPPTIIQKPGNAANRYADRQGLAPEAIVLHIAEGPISAVDDWFSRPEAKAGAHFCVGKGGEIHQYHPLTTAPFANGIIEAGHSAKLITDNPGVNPNLITVSCEHEGRSGDVVPVAQLEASTRLAAWVWQTFILPGGATGLAIDRDHFIRHADISPVTRGRCPGWSESFISDFIARVAALVEGPPIPDPRDERIRNLRDALTLSASSFDAEALAAQNAANRLRAAAVGARDAIQKWGS